MIRSKITLAFLMIILTSTGKCQDFWEVLPIPDTLDIASVVANDDGDIFVSTYSADHKNGIFKSVDGGYNWEKVFDSGRYGIISLAISDSGVLHAIGLHEGIDLLKSSDNGLTWSTLPFPDSYLSQKIYLVGEDTIFISLWADAAILLRSVDGGLSWEEVFYNNYGIQYIIDMAFSTEGDIYIGLMCYSLNAGGIYKSSDGGETWDFLGLQNHQVSSISIDSSNNLLTTVWSNMIDVGISGNIYYNHLTNEFSPLYFAWGAWGSAINSNNEFFTTFEYGALHSQDSGQTYEMLNYDTVNSCELYIDKNQFIYAIDHVIHPYLAKTIEPTVTKVFEHENKSKKMLIMPNPIKDKITGFIGINFFDESGDVSIIDASGKNIIMTKVRIENGAYIIDVSNIENGFYIIKLYSNGSIYSAKILKG